MTQSPTRSRAAGRTKTTLALPEADYSKLKVLSLSSSLSIHIILDQLAEDAGKTLNSDNSQPFLPIREKCIRKSYGISMEAKQLFEKTAKMLGCTRNEVIHTILNHSCQSIAQYLQELHSRHATSTKRLMEMCGRMLEIYEQPEYIEARKELAHIQKFAECNELLGHVELLYEMEAPLQDFIKKQQALTASPQHD